MDKFTEQYLPVVEKFAIEGKTSSIAPYGEGHINFTMLVVTDKKRYLLQKMNTKVFTNPEALMRNICLVTEHLKNCGEETLSVVPVKTGESFYKDLLSGECYRVYDFIEGTVTYQQVTDKNVFKNSGKAFGEFQNQLASFDASQLYETIPHFHDTPKRFRDFSAALKADKFNRAKDCAKEIDFVLDGEKNYSIITNALSANEIPLRVTHNDTKLNNILIDAVTGCARAVIDLDTVMPGSMLYDFGDSIRFGASTAAEDEKDINKVHFDLSLYEAYAEGYCGAVKDSITKKEKELLPYGAYMMTIECGMRFLGDYLSGDTYFATAYEGHNLVRCRTQLRLADEMSKNFNKMSEMNNKIIK